MFLSIIYGTAHLEPPLSVGLGPSSAGFDVFDFFFLCRFGCLSAGFGGLKCRFSRAEKNDEKG